jgi:ABC-2 type transport system permease protein
MYVAMFPSIQAQAANFDELMKNYPEALMKAFNLEELSFNTLEKFLAMEQFSFVWPLMVMFMLISLAGASIAKEIERGTMELLLSRPISRIKIFFSRYLAGLASLFAFTIFSIFAVVPLAKLHHLDYVFANHLTVAMLGFLFGWAIFSLAMMFSAMFSERGKVYMLTGGILLLMYVLNIVAALKENLDKLKYISFFHYFDTQQALVYNVIKEEAILVFAGVTIVCTICGALWFKKRDVAI